MFSNPVGMRTRLRWWLWTELISGFAMVFIALVTAAGGIYETDATTQHRGMHFALAAAAAIFGVLDLTQAYRVWRDMEYYDMLHPQTTRNKLIRWGICEAVSGAVLLFFAADQAFGILLPQPADAAIGPFARYAVAIGTSLFGFTDLAQAFRCFTDLRRLDKLHPTAS